MGKLSLETIGRIYHCEREIESGNQLIKTIDELGKIEFKADPDKPLIKNAFGEKSHFELGIPSGSNSHRLLQVSPRLARSIIVAHVANKESELIEANEQARIELGISHGKAQNQG